MRSIQLTITTVLALAAVAAGSSKIEFILETGGDNHADDYEADADADDWPQFTPGTTDGSTSVALGEDLTWAVRVLVHGEYNDPDPDGDPINRHDDYDFEHEVVLGPGDYRYPLGAANLVFDLQVKDSQGQLVPLGHANVVNGQPTTGGFWSSINDGDADGARGQTLGADPLANAAFASSYSIGGLGAGGGRLIDPTTAGGPNMDHWSLPSAAGWPAESFASQGVLAGFGAGYLSFDGGSDYVPGVGMAGTMASESGCGSGLVPYEAPNAYPQPLFEGQINTRGLTGGTYTLEVKATTYGNNIIHGQVVCGSGPNYGEYSVFARPANEVIVSQINFEVVECTVVGRYLFYNDSYYDGDNPAIDTTANGGTDHDHDEDAIDPTKYPLLPGAGLAQIPNYTGFDKGITGLMFDLQDPAHEPVLADFTFTDLGKAGTGATAVTPTGFEVRAGAGVDGSDRVVVTFSGLVDTWLQVDISTDLGLASTDTCYWGNAAGDGQSPGTNYILVNVTDLLGARDNQHTNPLDPAPVWDEYDFNKDRFVNATDILFVRDHMTTPLTAVHRITR